MDGVTAVQEIVEILVSGIVGLGQGIGQGISSFVTSLMYVTTGEGASATTTLSPFFIATAIFAGLALAVGLTRLVFNMISSWGAR